MLAQRTVPISAPLLEVVGDEVDARSPAVETTREELGVLMVHFVHTADVQIGMKATEAGAKGARLREARLESLRRTVALAEERQADFLLIAGDLFENSQVKPVTVSQVAQILQELDPTPVYILPGNHDWWDGGSVYRRAEFREPQARNLRVCSAPVPVEFRPEVLLYPCPITEPHSMLDPTAWIPHREEDATIRIGLAHGSLPHAHLETSDYPIQPEVLRIKGLDYLALGHYHGLQLLERDRVAMPGSPEQTKFGEREAGHVLWVEIDAAGVAPRVEPVRVGSLRWVDMADEWHSPAEEARLALQASIEALPDGPQTLLRLHLTGLVRPDELLEAEQLQTWLVARCENSYLLHAEVRQALLTTTEVAGALQELVQGDAILAGTLADLERLSDADGSGAVRVEETSSRSMDELMQTVAKAEVAGSRPSEVAREAVALLSRLAVEVCQP